MSTLEFCYLLSIVRYPEEDFRCVADEELESFEWSFVDWEPF